MPALSYSENVNSVAAGSATLTTASFSVAAGDVIVVKCAVEDSGWFFNLPTDTLGSTYTWWVLDNTASRTFTAIAAAVVASTTSMTVSAAPNAGWHSMTVEQWTAAVLASTPVTSADLGSGAPSGVLATTAPGSAVSWLCGDWNANSPSGRTYDSSSAVPVEDGLHNVSPSNYVAYYAYQSAASAGPQTLGLSAPGSQQFSLLGIEIQDDGSGGGGSGPDQSNYFGFFPWQ